ncbi:DUF3108 domain-containing protein [Microbaculum marinisediminis]|uniref:DUF3108 domain-containing protein n=1 Tax=Microbaculum marinisediminis TaxID=2931392 RepID=A0AAW5QWC5_9HYPH|nr:DUF3108 domain-containing protein [Microbaculum sp. A6E488]MCT8971452.1 DUF3108 domain-containing protein [Microbaculum sp. A6E488]
MKAGASLAGLGGRSACAVAFAGLVLSAGTTSAAEYKFKTDYSAYLAGVPVGKATLSGTFDGPQYRLDGYGKLTGLAGAVYDYTASASSAGRLMSGGTQPRAFSVDATDGKKSAKVRMTMNQDGVRRLKLTPPVPKEWYKHPNRVQVTDAHTKNTIDPMSALIVAGGNTPSGIDKRACERTVPIYNGRERFDVTLEFRKIESISSSDVPGGQVLVCGAHYRAIAGHRTDKKEVEMAEKIDIELKLAPVAGSDLLVPYRISIPTPIGLAVIQAGATTTTGALNTRAAALGE